MEIRLKRQRRGKNSTLSALSVDGIFRYFVPEDVDRGLRSDMTAAQIKALKVPGKTAIPTGRYKIEITYSPKFKRMLCILIGVTGFSGIRIHPGNFIVQTDGCLMPGTTWWMQQGDFAVGNSRNACADLQHDIAAAILLGEEIWITVEADYQ